MKKREVDVVASTKTPIVNTNIDHIGYKLFGEKVVCYE